MTELGWCFEQHMCEKHCLALWALSKVGPMAGPTGFLQP